MASLAVLVLTGCSTTAPGGSPGHGRLTVVAAESIWGSLASQLGGEHARVRDIIANPNADPHDYEPTSADLRAIATARMVIVNGVGYDGWASKLVAANPADGRVVLCVGALVGVKAGGNPHRWYAPDDVRRVIDQITADYIRLDPAHADYFGQRHDLVVHDSLGEYFRLLAEIRSDYAGTPIGASESLVEPLAEATGLDLLTPRSFLTAISEGIDPVGADKSRTEEQITTKQIKVYIYNSQNATPDVQAQVRAARAAHIPVTTMTETPTPVGASFQDWQVGQLTALTRALAQATGR